MLRNTLSRARRVLAVRLDNIGDVVMLTPALRALRYAAPEASITLMASRGGCQVAPMLPWVNEVLVADALWQDASAKLPFNPEREFHLIDRLRARSFDAAFIFTSFSQSPAPPAYACYLAGIPVRIGESKEFSGSVLSHSVSSLDAEVYQVDRNLHLLEESGVPLARREMDLRIPTETRLIVDALLSMHGIDQSEPFIAVAPGASCDARRYEPQRYDQAVRMLADATGLRIVLVGSERERRLTSEIVERSGIRAVNLAGDLDVPGLAAVIARASLLLCNNSAPLHIAAAFRRPTVVMYSGTDVITQWAPPSPDVVVLGRPTHCAPCYGFDCAYNKECLDVPARDVADGGLRLIANREQVQRQERMAWAG